MLQIYYYYLYIAVCTALYSNVHVNTFIMYIIKGVQYKAMGKFKWIALITYCADVIKKCVALITYCADVIKKSVEAEVIIKMNTTWCYKYMYKLMSSHIQLNFSHKTFVWIKHVKILICLNFCSNTCLICTVLVQKKNNKYFENSSDFHVVFTLIITTQISNERN
jgi:hypothetical protein